MSSLADASSRLRMRLSRRGQGGLTLVEVLVSVAVMAMVIGPVGAWMILSLNTVGPVAGRFSDASQARILNTYLARDVGSAEIALDSDFLAGKQDTDCVGGDGGGGAVKLQLLSYTDSWTRIVYSETSDGTTASLWRRVCANDDRGSVEGTEATEVMRRVKADSTVASCSPVCDQANLLERKQVSLESEVSGEGVLVHATQRATVDPVTAAAVGGFTPTPVIREVSRTLSPAGVPRELTVRFDGADSYDLLGTVITWEWSAEGPAAAAIAEPGDKSTAIVFTVPGDYTVRLKVTDETGQSASTSVPVTLTNRSPIVTATVSPSEGPPLTQDFAFDASGTVDADGDAIDTWQWDFGDGVQTISGDGSPTPSVSFLDTATPGDREVTLTVTDVGGGVGVWRGTITITGGQLPDVVMDPEPVVTGGGALARVGSVGGTGSATLPVSFRPADANPSARWEIVRPGSDVVLWPSDPGDVGADGSWQHTFGSADTGNFEVRLYLDGATIPAARQFRVNAAPTASFASAPPGGAYPLDVAFTDTSTDDRAVAQWSWDFGFFGRDGWTSTAQSPAHRFTNPGPYLVRLTVTDNDGAKATTVVGLNVSGTPLRPQPPVWQGSNVTFPAVPGATMFHVTTEHLDDEGCRKPGVNAEVDAYSQYDPDTGGYSIPGGSNTCTGAGRRTVATVQVEAGDGNLGSPSNQSVRTL